MSGPDEPDDDSEERRERSRQSAQDAAGDLARMGIDPRSLGLGGSPPREQPPAAPPADPRGDQRDDRSRVVPIRPGLPPEPAPQARRPSGSSAPAETPGWAVPDAPGATPVGPVEQMLAHTAARTPAPKEAGRLLRSVGRGVLTPDAAEAAGVERELVAAVRHRQTERRVVAFVSGKGGVGTTSVVSGVGAAFSALREDRTVVVDVQPGTPSLGDALGVADPLAAGALLRREDDDFDVPRTASGLGVVDGPPWEQPLQRRDLVALLDRTGADHTFNLVDAGRDPGDAAHATIARCDQVVVVTGVGDTGARSLTVALARVRQANPLAADRAVVVVVCPYSEGHRRAHREITAKVAVSPARVVVVPPDPHLAGGGDFDAARVSVAVREAMLEVAAAVALSGGTR